MECPLRGEEGGGRNVGEDSSMKKRECPERCMLDDRRNVLEDQVLKIAFFGIRVPLSLVQGYFWGLWRNIDESPKRA